MNLLVVFGFVWPTATNAPGPVATLQRVCMTPGPATTAKADQVIRSRESAAGGWFERRGLVIGPGFRQHHPPTAISKDSSEPPANAFARRHLGRVALGPYKRQKEGKRHCSNPFLTARIDVLQPGQPAPPRNIHQQCLDACICSPTGTLTHRHHPTIAAREHVTRTSLVTV